MTCKFGNLRWATIPRGSIAEGRAKLCQYPERYEGLFYKEDMLTKPEGKQKYKMLVRGPAPLEFETDDSAMFVFEKSVYIALDRNVAIDADDYSQLLALREQTQNGAGIRYGCPGRGCGIADVPGLTLVHGDVTAADILPGRGSVSWLLGALAALAEYPGAVRRLFKKTSQLDQRPLNMFNKYTVTLQDLASWKPVDIVVDEQLCVTNQGDLLGCLPGASGTLWCPYIEKAVAAHCGGWSKISNGTTIHAWSLLTGSHAQFMFRAEAEAGNSGSKSFKSYGLWDASAKSWKKMTNSPNDCKSSLLQCHWPEIGQDGRCKLLIESREYGEASLDEMFTNMITWKEHNFLLMGFAGGKLSDSATRSTTIIISGFCQNVASTGMDMVKVRNPWGKGELDGCKWGWSSPHWDSFPGIKQELQMPDQDDGTFWMEKDELFSVFHTFFLCGVNMIQFARGDSLQRGKTAMVVQRAEQLSTFQA